MKQIIIFIYDYFSSKRWLLVAILSCVVAALLIMLTTIKYNENIYDFLPLKGNDKKAVTLYQDISGGQKIIALLRPDSTGSEDVTDVIDSFSEKLLSGSQRDRIMDLVNQVDYSKVIGVTDFVYDNIPIMLQDSDYVRMEEIACSQDSMRRCLENNIDNLMMPVSGIFTDNIQNDPFSLFAPVFSRIKQRQTQLTYELDDGYIYTNGRQYAVVLMQSPYGSMESANNSELVEYVDSVAQATMQLFPKTEILITGAPVIAVGNAKQIKEDSVLAISIAVTLIVLLLLYSFRRIKNIILNGLTILFGWLFAVGFMSVVHSDISLIVLGISSIIIGIAVNYPLHFILHTDHESSIRETLKEMITPLLIGNITTVGAFACLIPLNAPALRDLGIFASLMLAGTILFVLIFLPHFIHTANCNRQKERLLFGRLSYYSPEKSKVVIIPILILTVVLGYFCFDTSFDTDMEKINFISDKDKEMLKELRTPSGMTDESTIYLVSDGGSWDDALANREVASAVLDSLRQAGSIQQYSDVTSFICSKNEQIRRIAKWNSFWDSHQDDALSTITYLAERFNFSKDAFDGFKSIVKKKYTIKDFEDFDPLISILFSSSFSKSNGRCSVVDIVRSGKGDLRHVEEDINENLDNGYSFDFLGMNSSVAITLSDDFNYICFACGIIVFIFLWLSFGRLELSIIAFLPMAVGWIWILGIMNFLSIKFNIVNVILATFIFGQGDDYTIFMTEGLIDEYAYSKKILPSFKNSIIVSALIMFIGIGSLIVAKHPALHSLAEVTIIGMFTVVLMACVIPPLSFNWLVRTKKGYRHSPITIGQIIRTGYCTTAYLIELGYGCVFGLLIAMTPWGKQKHKIWFHKLICYTQKANINCIYGVKSIIANRYNEKFEKGSVLICNHQSMLDPIYMLALHHKILILVSGKVWNNPFVHLLFKLAGFIILDQPIDRLTQSFKNAIEQGYNVVIFPEGQRNSNGITRFHKGAFQIAQEINADILPVYIHGANHVMPKGSPLASRGQITIEIGQRIPSTIYNSFGDSVQHIAKYFCSMYRTHFNEIRHNLENAKYWEHFIIYQYLYKGINIEKETRTLLKRHDCFKAWIDDYVPSDSQSNIVNVINAGNGQFSLLFAMVHPEFEIHSFAKEHDEVALARSCTKKPKNLHIFSLSEYLESRTNEGSEINLSLLLSNS